MKDNGAHVRYKIIRGRGAKGVLTGLHVCFYPALPPRHVIAALSRTHVVRALCAWVAAPYCRAAFERVAAEYAR